MLKSSAKILNTLSQTLPDDRPITAIQIVEHAEKCPEGFVPISRTHDQDQDADLWREHSIFTRKPSRYLCLSKTEGIPNYVVQQISVLGDKDLPPEGFSLLHRTADTEQRAWRKRQLCYRLADIKNTSQAVTDIIVCNKLKQAPIGFTFAGEINGMTVCFKLGNITPQDRMVATNNFENSKPVNNGSPFMPTRAPPERPPKPTANNVQQSAYPALEDGDHDYERLLPSYLQPSRPAPNPPTPNITYNTLTQYQGLVGIPFILNSRLSGNTSGTTDMLQIPVIKPRPMVQLQKEYHYDFSIERHT